MLPYWCVTVAYVDARGQNRRTRIVDTIDRVSNAVASYFAAGCRCLRVIDKRELSH